MADLYRKSALERLSSPEQLDKAITVSAPSSWLALLGITALVVTVIIWSVFGKLPTTITATGIVTTDGQTVICFIPYVYAAEVDANMRTVVTPLYSSGKSANEASIVRSVGNVAVSFTEISELLGADTLMVDYFSQWGPVVKALIDTDGSTISGGTLVKVQIVIDEVAPISKLFSVFGKHTGD
jgi:hypothetical protein